MQMRDGIVLDEIKRNYRMERYNGFCIGNFYIYVSSNYRYR